MQSEMYEQTVRKEAFLRKVEQEKTDSSKDDKVHSRERNGPEPLSRDPSPISGPREKQMALSVPLSGDLGGRSGLFATAGSFSLEDQSTFSRAREDELLFSYTKRNEKGAWEDRCEPGGKEEDSNRRSEETTNIIQNNMHISREKIASESEDKEEETSEKEKLCDMKGRSCIEKQDYGKGEKDRCCKKRLVNEEWTKSLKMAIFSEKEQNDYAKEKTRDKNGKLILETVAYEIHKDHKQSCEESHWRRLESRNNAKNARENKAANMILTKESSVKGESLDESSEFRDMQSDIPDCIYSKQANCRRNEALKLQKTIPELKMSHDFSNEAHAQLFLIKKVEDLMMEHAEVIDCPEKGEQDSISNKNKIDTSVKLDSTTNSQVISEKEKLKSLENEKEEDFEDRCTVSDITNHALKRRQKRTRRPRARKNKNKLTPEKGKKEKVGRKKGKKHRGRRKRRRGKRRRAGRRRSGRRRHRDRLAIPSQRKSTAKEGSSLPGPGPGTNGHQLGILQAVLPHSGNRGQPSVSTPTGGGAGAGVRRASSGRARPCSNGGSGAEGGDGGGQSDQGGGDNSGNDQGSQRGQSPQQGPAGNRGNFRGGGGGGEESGTGAGGEDTGGDAFRRIRFTQGPSNGRQMNYSGAHHHPTQIIRGAPCGEGAREKDRTAVCNTKKKIDLKHCVGKPRKFYEELVRKRQRNADEDTVSRACGELEKCMVRCLKNERDPRCVACGLIYSSLKHVGSCTHPYWADCRQCRPMADLLKYHTEQCLMCPTPTDPDSVQEGSHNHAYTDSAATADAGILCSCNITLCRNLMVKVRNRRSGEVRRGLEEVWHTQQVWIRIKAYLRNLFDITILDKGTIIPGSVDQYVSGPNFASIVVQSMDGSQMSMQAARLVSRNPVSYRADESLGFGASQSQRHADHWWRGMEHSSDRVKYGQPRDLKEKGEAWNLLKIARSQPGFNTNVDQEDEEGVIISSYTEHLKLEFPGGRYRRGRGWEVGPILGTGMSGRCSLALDCRTAFKFCVKEVIVDKFEKTEMEILSQLKHPNICMLYGAVRIGDTIYLLMEYVEGCSLYKHISLHSRLNELTAKVYLIQLLEVLEYLRQNRIVHEDIKADNILLQSGTTKLVLIDFGLARQFTPDHPCVPPDQRPIGSQTQWSPEKARCLGYKHEADMWAVGCVLVEMLSGSPPWLKRFPQLTSLLYVIGMQSPPIEDIPDYVSPPLKNLILQLWTMEPAERPLPADILRHPALTIGLQDEQEIKRVTQNRSMLVSGSSHLISIPGEYSEGPNESVSIAGYSERSEPSLTEQTNSTVLFSTEPLNTPGPRSTRLEVVDMRTMSRPAEPNVGGGGTNVETPHHTEWELTCSNNLIPNISIFNQDSDPAGAVAQSLHSSGSSVDLEMLMREAAVQDDEGEDDLNDIQIYDVVSAHSPHSPRGRPSNSNSDIQSQYEDLQNELWTEAQSDHPSLLQFEEDEDNKPNEEAEDPPVFQETVPEVESAGTLVMFRDGETGVVLSQLRVLGQREDWAPIVERTSHQIQHRFADGYSLRFQGGRALELPSLFSENGPRVILEVHARTDEDDWYVKDWSIIYSPHYAGPFLRQ